jgi:hypothetical protein
MKQKERTLEHIYVDAPEISRGPGDALPGTVRKAGAKIGNQL